MTSRPSKIDRLPEEVRDMIVKLRRNGRTIDEIMAKLVELDLAGLGVDPADMPSRAGLGRHLKQMDAITEEMRRQQAIAEAMVERGLVMDEGRTARLNVALAHGLLTKLMFTEEGTVATLDPEEAMFVARSIQSLASAAKADTDRELKVRAKVAKDQGLTKDTVALITREILGIGK